MTAFMWPLLIPGWQGGLFYWWGGAESPEAPQGFLPHCHSGEVQEHPIRFRILTPLNLLGGALYHMVGMEVLALYFAVFDTTPVDGL